VSIGAQKGLFSIRRIGVKHFVTVVCAVGGVSRGSALLFGISSLAVPAWDQGAGRTNLTRVLIAGATGTRALANSSHPSSREGRRSARGRNSRLWWCLTRSLGVGQMACSVISFFQREFSAVDPHAMHGDCKTTGERDDTFLLTAPLGDVHFPSL
jgi:hypothetical protein